MIDYCYLLIKLYHKRCTFQTNNGEYLGDLVEERDAIGLVHCRVHQRFGKTEISILVKKITNTNLLHSNVCQRESKQ